MGFEWNFPLKRVGLCFALFLSWGTVSLALADEIKTDLPPGEFTRPEQFSLNLALAAPTPLALQAVYQVNPKLSFAFEGGLFGLGISSTMSVFVADLVTSARWHPFSGPFFVGADLGYQTGTLQANVNLGALTGSPQLIQATLEHLFLGPSIGFLWKVGSRWQIGVDAGLQIPLLYTGWMTILNAGTQVDLANSLAAAFQPQMAYYSSLVVPRVALFRLGYRF